MRYDKEDTQRSNLNNIYLSATLAVKHRVFFLFRFIVLNKLTGKVRFDTAVRSYSV